MPRSHDAQPLRRVFAVVPAAGHSRRMGRPKLLLPVGQRLVIHRVIDALVDAGITDIWVHVREDDVELQAALEHAAVTVTQSPPTPGMRESTQLLLEELRARRQPADSDAWLLCPADHPTMSPVVIRALLAQMTARENGIWVPTFQGRRGHPVLFAWKYAAEVPAIPAGRGLNHLLGRFAADVVEVAVASGDVLSDLDTPEDYQRIRDGLANSGDRGQRSGHEQ